MSDDTLSTSYLRDFYALESDGDISLDEARAEFDAWLNRVKAEAWNEGFRAGWEECDDPDAFVNDIWDAKTPNPYRTGTEGGERNG